MAFALVQVSLFDTTKNSIDIKYSLSDINKSASAQGESCSSQGIEDHILDVVSTYCQNNSFPYDSYPNVIYNCVYTPGEFCDCSLEDDGCPAGYSGV